jgi:hypothetical protein
MDAMKSLYRAGYKLKYGELDEYVDIIPPPTATTSVSPTYASPLQNTTTVTTTTTTVLTTNNTIKNSKNNKNNNATIVVANHNINITLKQVIDYLYKFHKRAERKTKYCQPIHIRPKYT